jgi:hypothetical protein
LLHKCDQPQHMGPQKCVLKACLRVGTASRTHNVANNRE